MSNTHDAGPQEPPIEEGSTDAEPEQAVRGIVEQVRADMGMGHTHESVHAMLRDRFAESGLAVDDARVNRLAQEIITGL